MYKVIISPNIYDYYISNAEGLSFEEKDMTAALEYVEDFVEKGFHVVVMKMLDE